VRQARVRFIQKLRAVDRDRAQLLRCSVKSYAVAVRGMGAQMYTLIFEHITKRYGKDVVVDDLSFAVKPGRFTGLLGPNGAGKSTVMKMLLDLAAPTAGTATIGGQRYRELPDPARTVGVVLEPNAFHPAGTTQDQLDGLRRGRSRTGARCT
jgi:ABC-type multidrug transport system ATPase subunit